MKNIICLISIFISISAMAETQFERDQKLIRELELRGELAPRSSSIPSKSISPSNIGTLDNLDSDDASTLEQTRVIKVLLREEQSPQIIAEELDLQMVSGSDGQVAAFKVDADKNIDRILAELKSHRSVIDAKREYLLPINQPQ